MKRRPIKLKLGQDYIIWLGYGDKVICKFIQPTRCGFNFLNIESSKCILKHHLYPSKCENHLSLDWFWINDRISINKYK